MSAGVRSGSRVALEYELVTEDGVTVEGGHGEEAIEVEVGRGDVPEAVEAALEGAEPGAELAIELDGEELFGAYDPALIVTVPAGEIPGEPQRGDWIPVEIDDEEADGVIELEWRVVETDGESIILDGNHPGAGKSLTARVRVLTVDG